MSNVTINSLPTYPGSVDGSLDLIPIYDNSGASTNSVSRNNFLNIASQPVGLTDSQSLTNKTLTSPTISGPVLSGTITGTYTIGGTPTFPSSVVTLTGSQTLTNKILTSPTINTPSITNATLSADAITGFSASTTGTIYGMSVSSGVLASAALNNTVNTAALQANSVTTAKLATGSNFQPTTAEQNPYKFSVYRNAAQNTSSGAFAKVNFDTKLFDTGNNFDNTTNFRFTAPISGFYHFNATASTATPATTWVVSLYKNGSEFLRGTKMSLASGIWGGIVSELIQLSATDFIEVFVFCSATVALEVGATSPRSTFSGFLVSAT